MMVAMCLLIFASAAGAVEEPPLAPAIPPAVQSAPVAEPGEELLEFIGSWETEDGQWIDPAELETLDLPREQIVHEN
jgi:hypothetical protein